MYQDPNDVLSPSLNPSLKNKVEPQMRVIGDFAAGSFYEGRSGVPSIHFLGAGQTVGESCHQERLQDINKDGPFHIMNLRYQGESPEGPAGRKKLYIHSFHEYADDIVLGMRTLCGAHLKASGGARVPVSGFSTGALALLVAMVKTDIQKSVDHGILFSPLVEVTAFRGWKGTVLRPYAHWKRTQNPFGLAMDPITKMKLVLRNQEASSIPEALGIKMDRPWPTFSWIEETLKAGQFVMKNAHRITTPMLWILAEDDPIVNAQATVNLARKINRFSWKSQGRDLIHLVRLPSRDHNLLTEGSVESERVRHEIRKYRYERTRL